MTTNLPKRCPVKSINFPIFTPQLQKKKKEEGASLIKQLITLFYPSFMAAAVRLELTKTLSERSKRPPFDHFGMPQYIQGSLVYKCKINLA